VPGAQRLPMRMLVLSRRPGHPSLLVHEAKTGYMRQNRAFTLSGGDV